MTWQSHTLKPEQHHMNGACDLAQRLLQDGRLDAFGQQLVSAYIAQMQKECDFKLNTKVVC